MTTPPDHWPLAHVAWVFAVFGWTVGPVSGKSPAIGGRRWADRWTSDPGRAEALLRSTPGATGIGALMVARFAIDVDRAEALGPELILLLELYGTCQSRTRRGQHYVFQEPGFTVGSSTGGFPRTGWGEVRGAGTMIVVWGRHPDDPGIRYSLDPAVPLPECPPRLGSWLRPRHAPPIPTPVTTNSSASSSSSSSSHYGRAALDSELSRLGRAVEGERNTTLNLVAFRLGQLVGSGHLDAATTAAQLHEVALDIGLEQRESVATIRSGLVAGQAHPRAPYDPLADEDLAEWLAGVGAPSRPRSTRRRRGRPGGEARR